MLKIRLTRKGKKNKAFFRMVVAEHTAPIKGRFLEALGFLNPHTKERSFEEDRIKYWLEKGAQCSDTVHNLLVKEGIIKGPKRAVKMKKKEILEPAESAPASAEAMAGKEKAPVSAEATEKKEMAEKKEEMKAEKAEENREKTKEEVKV